MDADDRVFPPGRRVRYTNYARTALEVIIQQADLAGSRVMLPAFSCHGTFQGLFKKYEMEPVFVDSTLPTFHMDREEAERKADQADALLIVHMFGLPAEMDFWAPFAERHDLVLIEDCARALGAKDDGTLVGTRGDYAFYSLMKVSPTMKGGAVVFDGDQEPEIPPPSTDVTYYAPAVYGSRKVIPPALPLRDLDKINRNIFRSYLDERLDHELRENERKAARVRDELSDIGLEFQPDRAGRSHYWLSALVPDRRDELFEHLGGRDTPVYRVWPTPWAMSYIGDGFEDEYPYGALIADRIIHYPLQVLSDDGIEFVIEKTRTFYDE